jgi:hypothetical protein
VEIAACGAICVVVGSPVHLEGAEHLTLSDAVWLAKVRLRLTRESIRVQAVWRGLDSCQGCP